MAADTSVAALVTALASSNSRDARAHCEALLDAAVKLDASNDVIVAGGIAVLASVIGTSEDEASVSAALSCAEHVAVGATVEFQKDLRVLIGPLIRALGVFVLSSQVCKVASFTVAALPHSEGKIAAIAPLVSAIRAHASDALTTEAICAAFASIAIDSVGQEAIASSGGIAAIVSTLEMHVADVTVTDQAAAALCALAVFAPNQSIILRAGGVKALFQGLAVHFTDLAVAETVCTALINLSGCTDGFDEVARIPRSEILLSHTLILHSGAEDAIAVQASRLLAGVLSRAARVGKGVIQLPLEYDGSSLMVALLGLLSRQTAADSGAIVSICGVIQGMVTSPPVTAAVAATELVQLGGIDTLVDALRTHARHQTVVAAVVSALHAAATADPSALSALVSAAGLPAVLVAVAEAHGPASLSVAVATSALLSVLACEPVLQSAIGQLGGVEAVVRAMQAHTSIGEVQARACAALGALTVHGPNQPLAAAAGAIDALLVALETHLGSADVVEAACNALCNVALCADGKDALQVQGARAEVVLGAALAAHIGDAVVTENACVALQFVLSTLGTSSSAVSTINSLLQALSSCSPSNASPLEQVLKTLVAVSATDDAKERIASSSKALQYILSAVNNGVGTGINASSADASTEACRLLCSLASHAPSAAVICADTSSIVSLIKLAASRASNGASAAAVTAPLATLAALAYTHSNHASFEDAVFRMDVAMPVLASLALHVHDTLVAEAATAVLASFVEFPRVQAIIAAQLLVDEEGAGGIQRPTTLVARALEFHAENSLVSVWACSFLRRVALDPAVGGGWCACDATAPAVLAVLQRHTSNPHVVEEAAGALCNIAARTSGREAILSIAALGGGGAGGAVGALLGALSLHAQDTAAARELVGALANLALDDSTGRALAASAVPALLARVLSIHAGDADVARRAGSALATIAATAWVATPRRVDLRLPATGALPTAAAATQAASSALPIMQHEHGQAGPNTSLSIVAVAPLAAALRQHPDNADVCAELCALACNIAVTGGAAACTTLAAAGIIAPLCAALLRHAAHASLADAATRSLRCFSAQPALRQSIADARGVEALVAVVSAHGATDAGITTQACAALRNIASGGLRDTENIAALGGVEALLDALSSAVSARSGGDRRNSPATAAAGAADVGAVTKACRALATSARGSPAVAEGVALSGGAAVLLGVLRVFSAEACVVQSACKALHCVATHAATASGSGDEATTAALAACIPVIAGILISSSHAPADSMQHVACDLLAAIATISVAHKQAVDAAGVTALLDATAGRNSGAHVKPSR